MENDRSALKASMQERKSRLVNKLRYLIVLCLDKDVGHVL